MRFLEVAVFNYESAVAAKKAGANRLEVCKDYSLGGLTPSYEFVNRVRELSGISIFVMIRQKADNFVYSKKEMELMLEDIEIFKEMNVDGFVFGGLDENKNVHKGFSKEIVSATSPLPVTFHRAFDLCEDMYKVAEDVIDCGFKRILTSGGKSNAFEGRFVIRDLIKKYGDEIIFMPGGGIRRNNVVELENVTKAKEFHTAGIRDTLNITIPKIFIEDIIEIKNI